MIKIADKNGRFIELSEQEFLLALSLGLGVVALQLKDKHPKVAMYTRGLEYLAKKIRHTHLILTQENTHGTGQFGETNTGAGTEVEGTEGETGVIETTKG